MSVRYHFVSPLPLVVMDILRLPFVLRLVIAGRMADGNDAVWLDVVRKGKSLDPANTFVGHIHTKIVINFHGGLQAVRTPTTEPSP